MLCADVLRALGQFILVTDAYGAFYFVLKCPNSFNSRGYITMQDFVYNMNLLACMSFPSSESYIYVKN